MDEVIIGFHKEVEEKFISEDVAKQTLTRYGNDTFEITLKRDEYFVLGDNRHESQDSTHYGAFKLSGVMGKVERVKKSSQSKFNFYYEYIRDGKFFETLTNCF